MKNAVFVVDIGNSELFKYSKPSIEKYCEKFNIDLLVSTEK